MPVTLFESVSPEERARIKLPRTSIAPGIVENNCDLIVQGKVLVRLPSLNQEVWARLAAVGAGNGTGHFHTPNINDEVLVALVHGDPVDAYVLGGLWSTASSPPVSIPTDVQTKRKIRTGLTAAVGHEILFDDGLPLSITITSCVSPTGQQSIELGPKGIILQNSAGTVQIQMDAVGQMITVSAAAGIQLNSDTSISLTAPTISLSADTTCAIKGGMVTIN